MIKTVLALLIAATCAAGCTPGYRIYLDGYSELNEPVSKSAPIYVMTDPNAQNPILQRQVKAKVERLLLNDEYDVVDTPDKAKYELGFHVGMRSERIVDYLLGPDMYGGFYRGRARGFMFGYGGYTPYFDVQYDQWLVLKLYEKNANESGPGKLVWVGDAMMSTENAALRQAVNYLLVASIDILGVDTQEQVSVTIKENDPRLMDVATAP